MLRRLTLTIKMYFANHYSILIFFHKFELCCFVRPRPLPFSTRISMGSFAVLEFNDFSIIFYWFQDNLIHFLYIHIYIFFNFNKNNTRFQTIKIKQKHKSVHVTTLVISYMQIVRYILV